MPAPRFRLTAPVPYEDDIQQATGRALDALLLPPAIWFWYPAGGVELTAAEASRLARLGLRRALPDIWILYQCVWCIEMKRPGGKLSKTRIGRTAKGSPRLLEGQEEMFPKLLATGAIGAIAVAHSVDQALLQIHRWGIPMRGRVSA